MGNFLWKCILQGDKDDVSFEKLKGRRYYLKGSIDKMFFFFADAITKVKLLTILTEETINENN